jgi:antitoxin component HigA of HigAB toxin-antitoxin module
MSNVDEPIANEEEYEAALAEVRRLMDIDIDPELDPSTPDGQKLDALAERIHAYEQIHYPMGES